MTEAVEVAPGTDPDRASFTVALETAKDQLIAAADVLPDAGPGRIAPAVLDNLLPPRRARITPCRVKCPISRYAAPPDQVQVLGASRITSLAITVHPAAGPGPDGRRDRTPRDPDTNPAPDLVQRDFTADVSNRLWVTDLTMIATEEGPLWLSAIRDAYSRRVVAWETSARADADLVLTTLEYALASREVAVGELIHHADHGCHYTSVRLPRDRQPGAANERRLLGAGRSAVPACHPQTAASQ